MSRLYAILLRAPVPEFKALVKGDRGLFVYRSGDGIGPSGVRWRGLGGLGFDPESEVFGEPARSGNRQRLFRRVARRIQAVPRRPL